jgi:hypothetical protein
VERTRGNRDSQAKETKEEMDEEEVHERRRREEIIKAWEKVSKR